MKLKFIKYLLLLLIPFLLTCKKITEEWFATKVEGYVKEYYSGKVIVNADVFVKYTDNVRGDITVEQIQTDANGYYSIKFHADKDYDYFVIVIKTPYQFGDNYHKIKKGTKNNIELKIKGYNHIPFIIENIQPFDDNDEIKINTFGTDLSWNFERTFKGKEIDYFDELGGYINTKINFSWEVTKNKIITKYSKDILITENKMDTLFIIF